MKRHERELMNRINNNLDHADGPGVQLAQGRGNPAFVAQFDVDVVVLYYSVAAGVYTRINSNTIPANLQQRLPVFVFGNSDFAGGFKALQEKFPVTNWEYEVPFIFGTQQGYTQFGDFDTNIEADFQAGDLAIVFSASDGGTDYTAVVRARCNQVAYGTLLDALNSDTFRLNMLRYVIDDVTFGVTQYTQQVNVFNQSLFGKTISDNIAPNSYKTPEQDQNGIIDIKLGVGIDKHSALSTYVNYFSRAGNGQELSWSLFVPRFEKVTA